MAGIANSPQSDEYHELSQRYMRQANEEFARDDLLQAGEKAWGAVATAVKSVSVQRGWNHKHHDLTSEAVLWLADESGKQVMKDSYAWVEKLHQNFYEDVLTEQEVQRGMNHARYLLEELEAIRTSPGPSDFIPTSNRQKRRWEKLTDQKWDQA